MKFLGEIFLSELYKKYLMAPDGSRVGKITDFTVSRGDVFPLIDSFVIADAAGKFKLAYEEIEVLNRRFVLCRQPADQLPRQALAAKDILAVKDIWDKQIVDINGAKIVRVNDIKVREIDGKLCLIAVDVGIRGLMRRLGLKHNDWRVWKKMVQHIPYDLISWRYLQPLEDDITHLTLTVSNREMQSLHPYEIADLLTRMPPDNQESLINSLGIDKVAEAIPEMDERHQKDLLERMDEGKAADIMDAMSPDDAADILGDLPESKAEAIIDEMEDEEAEDVKELLQHEEDTAGGLMTTDFLAVGPDLTVAETLEHHPQGQRRDREHLRHLRPGPAGAAAGLPADQRAVQPAAGGPPFFLHEPARQEHPFRFRRHGSRGDHGQVQPALPAGGRRRPQAAGHHHRRRYPGSASALA